MNTSSRGDIHRRWLCLHLLVVHHTLDRDTFVFFRLRYIMPQNTSSDVLCPWTYSYCLHWYLWWVADCPQCWWRPSGHRGLGLQELSSLFVPRCNSPPSQGSSESAVRTSWILTFFISRSLHRSKQWKQSQTPLFFLPKKSLQCISTSTTNNFLNLLWWLLDVKSWYWLQFVQSSSCVGQATPTYHRDLLKIRKENFHSYVYIYIDPSSGPRRNYIWLTEQ